MKAVLLATCVLIFASSMSSARTWTYAATGSQTEAELIKVEGGKVFLRLADGREVQVEALALSLEDQEYLASQGAAATAAGSAGAWPNFRGPNYDGVSPDQDLLEEWPEGGPEKLWVYDDAGMGYSGFSVVDGKLYTLGTRGTDLTVICLDTADGSEIWSSAVATDDESGYSAGWGGGPRGTPTVSDGLVFALGPAGSLTCVRADDGEQVWQKNLVSDFGGRAGGWGFAESPFADGDKLIVSPGGNQAGMICLDKNTGEVIWEATGLAPGKAEYATPVPAVIGGTKQYVRLFESEVVGVSAEDGSVLWRSPWEGRTAVIPTPIVEGNEVFVASGYGVGSKLVSVDDNFTPTDVWQERTMKVKHGGMIKYGDYVYGSSEGEGLVCLKWDTGEMMWNEKGRYFGSTDSIAIADGMIYCLNDQSGMLSLVEATPEGFNLRGQFMLDPQSEQRNPRGKIWTYPLVVQGKLYLRDQNIIVCHDVSAE